MRIRNKISLLIITAAIFMALLMTGVSLISFRNLSIESEHEYGELASALARKELQVSFMKGAFDHEIIEQRVREKIPNLHEIRIVRSKANIDQFGSGEHEPNDIEKEVFRTGVHSDRLIERTNGVKYQFITPYLADDDCIQCHNVPVGTILGLVNIELDLTKQRRNAMDYTIILIVAFIAFAILLIYFLRQLVMPIVDTTNRMQQVVSRAEEGDFSGRLNGDSDDELGQLARQTNQLMDTLEKSFGSIIENVESMEKHHISGSDKNLLDKTVNSVKSMVNAVRFKQMIEDDHHLIDVYDRIGETLKGEFSISRFSIYEIDYKKNQMRAVLTHGLPKGEELWCSGDILEDFSACRACRTAQEVSSESNINICTAFFGNKVIKGKNHLRHLCIPLMQSGRIAVVIQIIFEQSELKDVIHKLPYIRTYLTESAPVIETKRLTEMLHESTLHDPMTGLYNRRFMDQNEARLVATANRQSGEMALMMCDVDHFKEINDTYGHQVGDMVLVTTAQIISKAVRLSDYVIRYGGEEFLAVLMDTDEKKVNEIAERIRTSLASHEFRTDQGNFSKTISIGIAIFGNDADEFLDCIRCADTALYAAKESGRNKAIRYQPGMTEAPEKDLEG